MCNPTESYKSIFIHSCVHVGFAAESGFLAAYIINKIYGKSQLSPDLTAAALGSAYVVIHIAKLATKLLDDSQIFNFDNKRTYKITVRTVDMLSFIGAGLVFVELRSFSNAKLKMLTLLFTITHGLSYAVDTMYPEIEQDDKEI